MTQHAFCPYCKRHLDLSKAHSCAEKETHFAAERAEGREPVEQEPISVHMNRQQRRAAMSRAKARIRREGK